MEFGLPSIGETLDMGVAWACTRSLPDLLDKKGNPYIGVFFIGRQCSDVVHQFAFSRTATRAAVAVLWDFALAKLGVREPTTEGARAMLEDHHAGRYKSGWDMHFYGHRCRIHDVAVSTDFTVVLRIEHPAAGEVRLVVDRDDNVLTWHPIDRESRRSA